MSRARDEATFSRLVAALDRPNRILVEEVYPGRSGEETNRHLWIAKTNKPDHILKSVDSDLFGLVVSSNLLVRGPDLNVWSHRNRYDDNLERVSRMAGNSRTFLRRTRLLNSFIGIGIIIFFVAIIVIARNSG